MDKQKRLILDSILKGILGSDNVYFQPPSNHKMKYPCIVYTVNSEDVLFADNIPYKRERRYQILVIDRDPDSDIPERVSQLPMCTFDRSYTADNLNHYSYNLYF